MTDRMTVFDRATVRHHRDRAAAGLDGFDFLLREVAERLAERVDDTTRVFPTALDVGCHGGEMAEAVLGRKGVEIVHRCDLSPAMARRAAGIAVPGATLVADEEALPFAPASFDLIVSNLSLHWVNDLPGALIQIRRALKPDGLFLGTLFGGATLHELRGVLAETEIELEGGMGPRVSPFADLRDAGHLLQRAGFAMPIADVETLTVRYQDPLKLMFDLRGMGEANAVSERRKTFSRRETLMEAASRYMAQHVDEDGRVPATFQVITLSGWAPAEGQPEPLAPGSATASLADALKTDE